MKQLLALEADVNESKSTLETEIVVYARIGDFDGLQKATRVELHEQMETSFKNDVRCRVRSTSVKSEDDAIQYTFTFKIPTATEDGFEANEEVTTTIDNDFFEGFRRVAEHRLVKTRYEFGSDKIELIYGQEDDKHIIEIPDIKYEIDVYTNPQGEVCEWCKIDIEVDNIINYLAQHHPELENIKLNVKISHLPFEPLEAILSSSMNEEQKAFVDTLWKEQFRLTPLLDHD